ncbi:carboxypeptidase M32, partial [Thermoplasmatales archaeon ex4484_6]
GFWKAFFPLLQEAFPVMKNRNLEDFHGAINIVRPSPIRVEADEVTYSMHIMVRFEIETELMDGKLDVDDIPQVWNEKYEKYLGLELRNDSEGCLQDIHWAMGAVGYFPTYALGNLYSAQFYDRALESIDGMEESISRGEFSSILGWLRENIHQKGKLHTAEELVEKVTGHPLTEDHFISYLKRKYSSIYGITL